MGYGEGFQAASFDGRTQRISMLETLAGITSLYTDKYLTLESSLASSSRQRTELQDANTALDTKIKLKNTTVSTYEREFLDRRALEQPFTFWRLRGVSTLQDWVLLIFFAVYGILCMTALALTLITQYPLYNFFIVLLSSFTIGIMITATIVRFA
jgi:hypothetical protein